MLRPRDFCGRDGRAFQRGKQDASKGISDSVAIAGFEWLGNELGVSICGCVLVFDESFRHFKTTVTDWHLLFSNVDSRLMIKNRLRPAQPQFENLKSKFLLSPGSPWRVRPRIQRWRPRDQRRNYKTRCEVPNKRQSGTFASGGLVGTPRCGVRSAQRADPTVQLRHRAIHPRLPPFSENVRLAVSQSPRSLRPARG